MVSVVGRAILLRRPVHRHRVVPRGRCVAARRGINGLPWGHQAAHFEEPFLADVVDFEPRCAPRTARWVTVSTAGLSTQQVCCTATALISTAVSCTAPGWSPKPARRRLEWGAQQDARHRPRLQVPQRDIHGTIDYYDSRAYDLLYLKVPILRASTGRGRISATPATAAKGKPLDRPVETGTST